MRFLEESIETCLGLEDVVDGDYTRQGIPWEQYYVSQPQQTLFRVNYAVLAVMPK